MSGLFLVLVLVALMAVVLWADTTRREHRAFRAKFAPYTLKDN